ncbi:uncharacterized protein BX664DRAFT_340744 [Halteromyces radiatus]|uniref:uncharacterized protein n=1 Tax=Halteromyces radiatus TaxID=101107 RepID=UPI00221FC952|nr:uncharacterized protein BX664DRAFT_340744 [Halteromyces radiatus]KAI8081574.1 hypothetical protein BX664DRAFT_340744 [Halteromyces radiatus]
MTELTDQQKLERRRLKRQQRILQSAGDRLERITGTAFPDRVSPSPSPSNSATSLRPVSSCSSNRMTNSHRPLRAVSSVPSLQQKQQDFSMDNINNTNSMDVAEHFPASNDLRRRTYDTYSKPIMEDIKSAENIPSILTESPLDETTPSFLSPINQKQPISLLNTLLMRKLYRQRHHHSLDPSLKYWNALHFASMIWLTFCGLYTEWQEIGNLDRFAGLLLDQGQSITQFVGRSPF